jgi:hypothetical protein
MRPRTDRRERSGDRLGQLRSFNRRPSCRPSTALLSSRFLLAARSAQTPRAQTPPFSGGFHHVKLHIGLRSKLAG